MDLRWMFTALMAGVLLQMCHGASIIGDMVSKVLSPQSQSPLNSLRSQLDPSSRSSPPSRRSGQGGGGSRGEREDSEYSLPKLRAVPPPRIPTIKPPSPLEINRGFGRVLSVVSILGQVDGYIAERAKALVRKLLLLVDDDAANSVIQY